MTAIASANTAPAQNDVILTVLLERLGEWVPMPELAERAGCYAVHSRVANLRERGFRVECRVDRHGRAKHSYYRIATVEPAVLP